MVGGDFNINRYALAGKAGDEEYATSSHGTHGYMRCAQQMRALAEVLEVHIADRPGGKHTYISGDRTSYIDSIYVSKTAVGDTMQTISSVIAEDSGGDHAPIQLSGHAFLKVAVRNIDTAVMRNCLPLMTETRRLEAEG